MAAAGVSPVSCAMKHSMQGAWEETPQRQVMARSSRQSTPAQQGSQTACRQEGG